MWQTWKYSRCVIKRVVRGFLQGFEMTIRGGKLKMVLVARGLACGLGIDIGTRILAGKVFKIDFSVSSN